MTEKPVLYPLLLLPSLHIKVWGGRQLETVMRKRLPTSDPYGESWEMHDTATVANGPYAGKTLGALLAEHGAALIGDASNPNEGFPLLLKFLDANAWLSVQVHPDDALAEKLEGEPRGKTEAWIVLAADAGAKLALGVKEGVTREQMAAAITANTLQDLMRMVDVQAGDVVYLDAGTVHALGPGVLVYEIQQSSDQTYRLYDWGRMGLDGKPRALHIDKGLQAAKLDLRPDVRRMSDKEPVFAGPYFETRLHRLLGETVGLDTGGRRFHVLSVIRGAASVSAGGEQLQISVGQSVLIPAAVGAYKLAGTAEVLRSNQPG